MIQYFEGCVVEAFKTGKYFAMLHQANCFNTMNSGVAKAIREEFPEAYAADCKTKKGDELKMGTYSLAEVTVRGHAMHFIANLYGQYYYGRDGKKYTEVDKLEQAIDKFGAWAVPPSFTIAVCIPRFGCGLGGADWDTEVVPVIERQLINRGIKVHVYDN